MKINLDTMTLIPSRPQHPLSAAFPPHVRGRALTDLLLRTSRKPIGEIAMSDAERFCAAVPRPRAKGPRRRVTVRRHRTLAPFR